MNNMALTLIGTVHGYSAIEKPSDKFGPATYSCKLTFTGEAAKKMKAAVDALMAESKATKKASGNAKPPYTIVDKQLIVSFKRKAEVTTKADKHYEFDVKLFDCKSKPVGKLLNIGEGTELIISYSPYMWNVQSQGGAGVTLQMEMAQVVKLVKYSSNGGGGNPFEEVDGDFTVAEKDTNPFDKVKEKEIGPYGNYVDGDDADGDF